MFEIRCSRHLSDDTRHQILRKLPQSINSGWLIVHHDDLDKVFRETIVSKLWTFKAEFLGKQTGLNENVFLTLHRLGEDAQVVVLAIVRGTCGVDAFVDSFRNDNRGHFLSTYDDSEYIIWNCGKQYYCYRLE